MAESITKTWTVKAPDGTPVSFVGPTNMTDEQVIQRARQEYAIKTGSIPTTEGAGQIQSIGDTLAAHGSDLGTAVGLTGAVTANPLLTAASPAIGRAIKASGQYIAGRKVDAPTGPEVAALAGEGALAGYGPVMAEKFAASTVPHVSSISGNYVRGMAGSGFWPWAVRSAGEAAHAAAQSPLARSAAVVMPAELRDFIMSKIAAAQGATP